LKNFYNLPEQYSDFKKSLIAVIPVPFDLTSTWKKGADHGPDAVLDASCQVELYDIETDSEAFRYGIFTHTEKIDLSSPESMVKSVRKTADNYLKLGKLPVVVGGEHTVSIGAVQAAAGHFENLSVLQLDAHTDLREIYEGSELNHACVMARIKENCPFVQAGIRSMDSSEKAAVDYDSVFFAEKIRNSETWHDSLLNRLSDNVYITLDLDVFDPSVMPSTGTPEPGGLGWYEVIGLLRKVFKNKNVCGFDVVELCPDGNHSAEFLAAKLIYKMITYYIKYTDKS
jgi:agmatinase